jgi:hypothetical protein
MPRVSTLTLLLHGAGSCPETAYDLLSPVVAPGSRAETVDARGSVDAVATRLADTVLGREQEGHEVVRVAGISLGAHAAALWAARSATDVELVLVMPAWTGEPGPVAAATLSAADEVERLGSRTVLARLRTDPSTAHDWVLDELERGWSGYDDSTLVTTLRAAGTSPGPTLDELRSIIAPAAVVGLADDPLHPEQVARDWASVLPLGRLTVVARTAPATDRGALGRAAAQVLTRLSGSR